MTQDYSFTTTGEDKQSIELTHDYSFVQSNKDRLVNEESVTDATPMVLVGLSEFHNPDGYI